VNGCPLENPRGFYVAYLRGNDVDFTEYFCQLSKYINRMLTSNIIR